MLTLKSFWLAGSGHRRLPWLHHCHGVERAAAFLQAVKGTERYRLGRALAAHFPEHHQPARLRIRERLEQDRIHRAEDGGAGADSQCQGECGDNRKTRIAEQLTRGILQVGEQGLKGMLPSGGAPLFASDAWIT